MIQSSNSELGRSYFLKAPRAAIKPKASDTPGDFKRRSRDRGERRKSPGLPGAAIAIFPDHRDRRIKYQIFATLYADRDDQNRRDRLINRQVRHRFKKAV